MALKKDSIANVITVALVVCFACAIVVSGTAVSLKPQRAANKEADRYKNILEAAGLFEEGKTAPGQVNELFKQFTTRVVDLDEKRFLTEAEVASLGIDVATYDQRKASKDPGMSRELSNEEDVASISRRARYSVVYLLQDETGLQKIVLPVHGYGLWSTMYGYLALRGDLNTVAGITFYEQQETAGLGGEVDNPKWKASWQGKEIYSSGHDVALRVIKGTVDPASRDAEYHIDGLSGATLTSRGVENLIHYWLGKNGFGPMLKQLQTQEVGAI